MSRVRLLIGLLALLLVATACSEGAQETATSSTSTTAADQAGLPNPASVFCEEQGGKSEIRTDAGSGGQTGVCVFPDGSECDEWMFMRGFCKPGDSTSTSGAGGVVGGLGIANPASVYCEQQGGTVDIRTDTVSGGQTGYCIFASGSECEEWAFFRAECAP